MKLIICQRGTMNTLRRAVEQSPHLVKKVMAGGGAVSTNAEMFSSTLTTTRRNYSSLYEGGYLPRYRSSFREASPYDVSSSSSGVGENEQDPRDYGYRVTAPRSFSTSAVGMESSTTTTTTHVLSSVTEQTTTMNPPPPPVDEYAFIMSSSEPVSAEECQEVIASHHPQVVDTPSSSGPNTTVTPAEPSSSSVLDSMTECSDRWYDHGVDDIDMALD